MSREKGGEGREKGRGREGREKEGCGREKGTGREKGEKGVRRQGEGRKKVSPL
jgi:hypothetical protein